MKRPRLRRRRKTAWASSPDPYTPPSFRGPIIVAVVCLVAIALIWLAYGWALGELARHGVSVPSF